MAKKVAANRLEKMLRAVDQAELDAVVLLPGANSYYHAGVNIHLMERPTLMFVFADRELSAVIPSWRSPGEAAHPEIETVYWQDSNGYQLAPEAVARGFHGARRVGVEGRRIRFFDSQALRAALPAVEIVDAHSSSATSSRSSSVK